MGANDMSELLHQSEDRSEAARRRMLAMRGEPLFLADWLRAVFVHYEVPADKLQREVPFELDLHDGKAYVTLVAFTLDAMRLRAGGRLAAWMMRPIASNRFLNVRTYVRHRGEPGIYFIREWLDNRLSVRLGPATFGLPYRFGKLNYEHAHESGAMRGVVRETSNGPAFRYRATLDAGKEFQPCAAGSLDDFLIERYLAFTSHGGTRRFFRVWHPPWRQARVEVVVDDRSLPAHAWSWFADARLVGANYSPGVTDVWMGRPQRIVLPGGRNASHRLSSCFHLP